MPVSTKTTARLERSGAIHPAQGRIGIELSVQWVPGGGYELWDQQANESVPGSWHASYEACEAFADEIGAMLI